MSILIASQTAAAMSDGFGVEKQVVLEASNGIASGEDSSIESQSEIDGWRDTGKVLTSDEPTVLLEGPCVYRINKPVSASAYGVEIKQR